MSNILCYDSQGKYLKRLYQWDTNQTITISGLDEAPFPIFHFTKDVDGEALVVNPSITSTVNGISIYGRGTPDSATYDASEHNGEKYLDLNNGYVYSSNGTSWSRYKENGVDVVLNSTDTVRVSVPNVLLQTSGTLYVYMVELTDANGDTNYEGIKTTHLIKIPVNARPKPADYEYEENVDYESVAILSTRLSTLIANLSNADSSSVAAEVIDMRSPVSGAAYDTAGEYIRAIDTRLTAAETAIESKANSSDVTAALATKASVSDLATKADAAETTAALNTKANAADVTAALALKANTSEVTALIATIDKEVVKFTTRTAADAYLSTADAAAGQIALISETANDKFKLYVIEEGSNGLQYEQASTGSCFAATLQDIPASQAADPDLDYYIGSVANGYVHYRYITNSYVPVGGDISSIQTAINNINTALAAKGVALSLNDDQLSLLDSNNNVLGDVITIPQTGITGLAATVVTRTGISGDSENWLEIRDQDTNLVAECKLPAGGGSGTGSYSSRLYNRTGGSTTFTATSGATATIKFSFHEDDDRGRQTSEPGHVVLLYKDSDDPDSAYREFQRIDSLAQDTVATVDVTDILSLGDTINVKVTAKGTTTQEQSQDGTVVDTTMTAVLLYTIKCVEISIESKNQDFPNNSLSTAVFTGNTSLTYTTRGNGIMKTMHIEVDGEDVTEPFSIGKSHLQVLSYELPIREWSYGAHNLCYYFVTDDGAVSNKLHNIVMYNDGAAANAGKPIVGLDKSVSSITFGEAITVKYVANTPGSETTEKVEIRLLNSNNQRIRTVTHTNVAPNRQQELTFDSEVYGSAGTYRIQLVANDGLTTVTHQVVVNEYVSPYNILPVSTGLVYYFNAAGHSNSDVDRDEFAYNYNGVNIYADNDDFNWATNGYVNTVLRDRFRAGVTHNATALRISGAAKHTINLPIFTTGFDNADGDRVVLDSANNATPTTNGRTIEFDYNVVAASSDNAIIIDCADTTSEANEEYIGFKVTPLTCALKSRLSQNGSIKNGFITKEENLAAAYLRKNTNTSADRSLDTEKRVHLSFVIEGLNTEGSGKQTVNIFIDGKYAKSLPYVSQDSFTQSHPIVIGSEDAIVDLYNVRVYNRALSANEVAQNYYASQSTISEREDLARFNDLLDTNHKVDYDKAKKRYTCLKIKGELAPDKSRKRYCGLTLSKPYDNNDGFINLFDLNDLNPGYTPDVDVDDVDNFVGRFFCSNKVQGTSSQRFIRKNYKVYLVGSDGKKVKYPIKGYSDGTFVYDKSKANTALSIPESTFCFKMDYMSADHANTFNANMADSMFGDTTAAQERDSRCQNTIYGYSCLLFVEDPDTGDITFAGDGTLNNDKSNFNTFGLVVEGDDGNDTSCQQWDFRNNSTDICMFKTDKLQEPVVTTETVINDETGEEETVETVVPAVVNALESIYPDQGDLEEEGLTPNYDHIQVLYTWLYQRANFWDEQNSSARATKKQIFKNEFAQHFNMNRALTYYCFLDYTALVDNHAKNIHLRSENIKSENIVFTGNQTSISDIIAADGTVDASAIDWENSTFATWILDLYDLDSCFGAENSGYLYIPYYADWDFLLDDGVTYAINGHESRLWLMFREAFGAEIKAKFQTLAANNQLTYENFKNVQLTNGTNLMASAVVNRDMEYKYNDAWTIGYTNEDGQYIYTDAYKYMQRDRTCEKDTFLYQRSQLKYSQYQTSQFRRSAVKFRAGLSSETALPIYLKATQYIYPAVGLNDQNNPERYSYPNGSITLLAPDTETTISDTIGYSDNLFVYSAVNLSKLDISAFQPYEINLDSAANLKELALGSERSGYSFSPRTTGGNMNFSSHPLLEKLNVGGALGVQTLTLTDNTSLKELKAANSAFTTIVLPNGGLLSVLHLPATLTSLEIRNQTQLTDFQCGGYDNITKLIIQNTPSVPISNILINHLDQFTDGLRLEDVTIELGDDENDVVGLLLSDDMKGKYIDNTGSIDTTGERRPYISGTLTLNSIGTSTAQKLRAAYPNLTVTAVEEYSQYEVKFVVNGTVVETDLADKYNAFTVSYNSDGTKDTFPYKPSSGTTHYLFNQWVITPTTQGQTTTATVNESTISNINADITVTAEFFSCTLPEQPREIPQGGYMYWNTYADGANADRTKSAYSTGEFYAICMSDAIDMLSQGYYTINKQIRIDVDEDYKTFFGGFTYLLFDIVGVQHYELSAYPGRFANVLFSCHHLVCSAQMNVDNTNAGGWDASRMRHWLNGYENTKGRYLRMTSNGTKAEEYYFTISGNDSNGQTGTIVNTSTSLINYSQSLWGKLPYQLRAMISSVNVKASSGLATKSTDDMITSADKLFLFSINEVFNDNSYDVYTAEVDRRGLNGEIIPANRHYYLDYFTNNGSTLGFRKKDYNGANSGSDWWLRSPEPTTTNLFRYVNGNGSSNYYHALNSYGVVFGFNIGIPTS